jgi:hypothetical protein
MRWIVPRTAAGRSSGPRLHLELVSIAHHLHVHLHSRYMRSGSSRQRPAAASSVQRCVSSSWQRSDWQRWHVTGQLVRMYIGLESHSPTAAHCPQNDDLSSHAAPLRSGNHEEARQSPHERRQLAFMKTGFWTHSPALAQLAQLGSRSTQPLAFAAAPALIELLTRLCTLEKV